MSWRAGIVALLLTWLVLPSPGAAAVQRFTDGQGVIHISNTAPALCRPQQEPLPEPASAQTTSIYSQSAAATAVAPLASSPSLESVYQPAGQARLAAAISSVAAANSPESAAATADTATETAVEVLNGTRTGNLAHLVRALLVREGFSVTETGDQNDFQAQVTFIYYRAGEEKAAKALQEKIFPWAEMAESSRLENGIAIKVLLGNDLLEQPRIMARLNGEDPGVSAIIAQEVRRENQPPVVGSSRTGLPAPAAAGFESPVLQKVAYEVPAAEPASTPAPMVTAGGIRRYRDGAGIWHISNLAPEGQEDGPAILEARQDKSSAREATDRRLERVEAMAAQLPLKKVSWSPEPPDLLTLPITASSGTSAPAGSTPVIRHYRDRLGVIHINNETPEAPPAAPPVGLQARASSAAAMEDDGPLVWKPAAWSPDTGLPLRKVKAEARSKAVGTTEGGIRRWRDKKGVWHIETPEYAWPAGVPVPERLAGLIPGVPAASTPPHQAPAARPPAAMAAPGAATGVPQASPAPYAAAGTRVTAFRDRKGRLKITNESPALASGPRPPAGGAIAPAELEPLIAEAAIVHHLPASLIRAVIKTESDFCSWAVSPKGAMGLMQLMPGTAAFLGVADAFNPRQNILGGCRYLRLLIDFFGGSVPLALAGYNAGFQRVVNCGFQVPPIKETQDFVTVVLERYVVEEKRKGLPWT